MRIELDIEDYTPERGIVSDWDDNAIVATRLEDGDLVLVANREGLISRARLFFTLAQETVSSGSHVHLDAYNALEDGSVALIVERSNDDYASRTTRI